MCCQNKAVTFAAIGRLQAKPFSGGNNNAKKTLLLAIKNADDARLI